MRCKFHPWMSFPCSDFFCLIDSSYIVLQSKYSRLNISCFYYNNWSQTKKNDKLKNYVSVILRWINRFLYFRKDIGFFLFLCLLELSRKMVRKSRCYQLISIFYFLLGLLCVGKTIFFKIRFRIISGFFVIKWNGLVQSVDKQSSYSYSWFHHG